MNIGIIVYSYTGNTLLASERLKERLQNSGHRVTLEAIKASDERPNQTKIDLTVVPDPTHYDRIILASPVRGFQVSPIMKAYLEQWPILNNKPVACFVTHAFPYEWLGGKTAIKMMSALVNKKQARLVATSIINKGKSETDIVKMLNHLSDEALWS